MRKSLLISLALYTIAFWIWRLPFLLWLPLPEFGPDAFDYYALTQAFRTKTALAYPLDVPLGFPIFLYVVGLFSSKAIVVIWIQVIIKFTAGFLLIYVFCRYYGRWGVFAALLMTVYVTDSWSLRYDTCFIPDSLYNSFMMMTVAVFIVSLNSFSHRSLALLSTAMFLVAFTRSNGIFIYFLVPVVAIILFSRGQGFSKYFTFLAPFIVLQTGAFYLKNNSGFLHPSRDRLTQVLSRQSNAMQSAEGTSYFAKKWNIAKDYFRMPVLPSFYHSLLPVRYHIFYETDVIHDPEYKMFDWSVPIPDDLRKLVYSEYYHKPESFKKNKHITDISYAYSNPFFLMLHLIYKFQSIFFRNVLWYALFFIVLIFSAWVFAASGFTDEDAMLVLLLCASHLLGLLVVILAQGGANPRYAHVTEFIMYLAPVFALMIILPSGNERKS